MFVIATACLSGFLFGYFMAIISGALFYISSAFSLSLGTESMFVSILLLGAVLGSLFGGRLIHQFGRKKIFSLTGLCLICGSVILLTATSYLGLLLGRVIQGIGIGIISVLAPLYLGEISLIEHRGKVVSAYQLMMNFGIFSAYLINDLYFSSGNWQMMFIIGLIPVVLQFILIFFIPESPLWLFRKKEEKLALKISDQLQLPPVLEVTQSNTLKLGAKTLFYIFWIGISLSICQQFSGINAVIYYSPRIFYEAGFQTPLSAMIANTWLGATFFLACLLSVFLVDKIGRRRLLLISVLGMMISLSFFSLFSLLKVPFLSQVSIFLLVTYVVCFSIGIGPVVWVLLAEIYPDHMRDKSMAVSLTANWLSVFFVIWTFPYLLSWGKIHGVFGIYSFMNFVIFLFVLKYIPETKKKSFEQISRIFVDRTKDSNQ